MRHLLDTHAFIWFINGDKELSTKARKAIESEKAENFISIASLWEIAIKISLGRLTLQSPFPEIAQQMLMKQRAMAYIEAKDKIGNASIEIIQKMINDIDNKLGVKLTDERKSQMINNLLIVMTSENQSQPVLQLESGEKDMKINNNFEDILNKQNKLLKDILNKIKE